MHKVMFLSGIAAEVPIFDTTATAQFTGSLGKFTSAKSPPAERSVPRVCHALQGATGRTAADVPDIVHQNCCRGNTRMWRQIPALHNTPAPNNRERTNRKASHHNT
jgi:hypothetical protein